ncbi:MAG: PepSY domain-containing protein [Bacteroidales bacterium]|nr:PepSY domain-containing protein [Bacteroidales bacterium]
MKKIFHKLHLWLSIPFGLLISVICLSGAALVFENEIMELCYPDRYFVKEMKEKPLPIVELLENVSETLPDSVSVTNVSISPDPERLYQVGLSKPRRASVYVDPYTGEVQPRFERAAFFTFMFRTHRWLLDTMKPDGGIFWGKMIVGVSTLLFVFIIITGIILWIPKSVKTLKRKLKISFHRGWWRFWYDLHVVGGMYIAIVLLALALTGLTWSFPWYRAGFYKVFGVELQQQSSGHGQNQGRNTTAERSREQERSGQQQREGEERRRAESREGRRERSTGNPQEVNIEQAVQTSPPRFFYWQPVYEQLKTENPEYSKITISDNSANVSFNRFGNQRASDRYTFDSSTGKITEVSLYKDQEKSNQIRGWIYSVHVGNWGGWFTRIITFIAAVLGGILPLTGYYFWIKKSKRKRRKKQSSVTSHQ